MKKNITPFGRLFLTIFCATAFFTCTVIAQTPQKTNTLLWKISGKGLSRPSYLYGTMHVQDDRAFRFNDSVMVKLRECSAFAMELLPEALVKALLRDMSQQDNSNRLRNSISEEEYNRLATELKQRAGLDIENINISKPWVLKSLLDTSDTFPHKDKPTFLDGYLYRLARILRKETFGLETPEEQILAFEEDTFEKQIRQILDSLDAPPPDPALVDSFISIYSDGRLDELEHIVKSRDDSTELRLFLRRNHKMIERLLPLMERHAVFVAVGAAHLPGEEGLIDLLQKKGYTVTPVPATFNGPVDIPEDISLDEPWYTLHSEAGYSIDLPSEPVPYNPESDELGFIMFMYPDIGTGIKYFVSHLELPIAIPEELLAGFFGKFGKQWAEKQDGEVILDSSIVHDGFLGQELDIAQEKAHLRMRIFLRENILYMFMTRSGTGGFGSHDITRFFSSVRFTPIIESISGEQTFTSKEGAFSILMPDAPTKQVTPEEEGDVSYTTTMYVATDEETETAYFVSYVLYEPGQLITDPSFREIAQGMAENMEGDLIHSQDTVWEGYPMYKFYAESAEDKFLQGRLIVRGSRLYIIFAISKTINAYSEKTDRLLNSLHFTDFQPANWQTYTAPDTTFRVLFPAQPIIERDTSDHNTTAYTAQDVFSGISYLALVTDYNPYYYVESEEKFFSNLQEKDTDDYDTVYTSIRLPISGYPGLELEVKSQNDLNVYRMRYVLRHHKLYTLIVHAPREWLHTPAIDTFFQSFSLLPVDDTGSLFTRKTQKLVEDILSGDTARQRRATESIASLEFDHADLPFLYQLLRHSFPDDNNVFRGVRAQLLNTLHSNYDTTTLTFLRELYPTISDTLDLRDILLRVLAAQGTEESLTTMADLLTTLPRNESMDHYNVFSFISTADTTCRVMFPRILPIVESEGYRGNFCEFLAEALDSGIVTVADIASIQKQFSAYGASTFDKYRVAPESNPAWRQYVLGSELRSIARISGYFADPASIPLLRMLAADPDSALAFDALCALEQCNQPVSDNVWEGYAASPVWRNRMYLKLDIIHKLARFPEKYRTQAALAEGDLVRLLEEDEETVADIQLLRIHEVPEGENQGRYFVYKFRYAESGEEAEPATWYVGISGPQPLDKKTVTGDAPLTRSHFQTIDEMSIDDHITSLLEENSP